MLTRSKAGEPIAIIGVGLRLPQADSLDTFWAHLAAGRSLITEAPPQRWDATALRGDPSKGNKTNSIWGAFLEDADCFDATFFNIAPREAAWMDPQQRFALELAWSAIEDSGYRASALSGSRTGVYMGVCHWDYAELLEKHLAHVDAYTPTGIAFSIIANRVSHFFDFRGPSITNDTACAASMVSVYEGVRALQAGECDLALAGGVNLIWSPNHFVAFSKSGMLSKDGRSKAFDQRADGYVRGEGGAMLLLKPLTQARADGDPIHAVIRGIGTNHGGRTNSLTVTNPKAQAELIAGVYRDAGVTPQSVSYIEAHGPGTPLGDPIEIAGLKTAFAALYRESGGAPEPGSCGVGSVKTNIGHLEGAAGVAGMVKVLAAMRYGALPANVDFTELNALIDLTGSPFRIQSELTPWPRERDRPRRAGVSSFGFGGSNAHVLLEDDMAAADAVGAPDTGRSPMVIPLSAKDDARLSAYAARLLQFLEAGADRGALSDLAYTIQVGREAMAARVAFVVQDREALMAALRAFIAGTPDARVRRTGVRGPPEGSPQREADLWVDGHDVDWTLLYTGARPRRIHLPTYPFARERHWMDESLGGKDPEAMLHPLLHRNVSRFDAQRYLSRFKGSEFFWADHRVGDAQVLPGVAFLEIARAAYEQATLGGPEAAPAIQFENVVWTRPIRAGAAPVPVEIRLRRLGDDRIAFEIESPDPASRGIANAQGVILGSPASGSPTLDIPALRARAQTVIQAGECYERLRSTGVLHGPSFQAIARLYRGDGFVLANLKLPRLLRTTLETCPLHPILLDAAIQAWIGLDNDATPLSGPAVPFACRSFSTYGPCEGSMWAFVHWSGEGKSNNGLKRLDIDLCDKEGRVRARFRDLALRIMADTGEPESVVYSIGQWEPRPLAPPGRSRTDRRTTALLAGFAPDLALELGERAAIDVAVLDGDGLQEPAAVARNRFGAVHGRIANWLRSKPKSRYQLLIFVPESEPAYLAAPLVALLKTASMEQPDFEGAILRLRGAATADRLAKIARAERERTDAFCEILYTVDDQREVWRPVETEPAPGDAGSLVHPEAVYWITGGLGELGMHFAGWLAARGATRIVLSGRRHSAGGAALDRMNRLRERGVTVHYASCDMASRGDVLRAVKWVETEVGPLRGVIHAAGTLRDGYILNKDAAGIDAVFAPKVSGTLHLDEATRELPLDFMVFCSSVAAVFGNAGQADYAGANAFMDAFAEHRSAQVARGERRGRTLSIAWPLWANGGMTVDAPSLAALHRRFGTVPLPTDAGLRAFERILGEPGPALFAVHSGDRHRIAELLRSYGEGEPPRESAADVEAPAALASVDELRSRTVEFLKEALAEATRMDPAKIKSNRRLEEYGLDSIVIVELTNRLEESLGTLSKTLFFEYVDLDGVAGYLVEKHRGALETALVAGERLESGTAEAAPVAVPADRPAVPRSPAADHHDIAIVGLSIRVSKASDQKGFWELLAGGRHGFEKYPESRWNHAALLHPERDVLGKTVVRTGAFLDGVDEFDPRYFRISQYEAELMSPEVRLFLESCVEALEDAGYSREYLQARYGGDVAVIVGSMTNEYDLFGFQNMLVRGSLASGSYTGTIPNMVSYFYGFTGPSYFLDTMCSGSATCVHEAVHMLRAGRCKMALAGGVSLLLHPQKLIAVSQEHFTTKTAEVIRGYGLGADGTILGEGVGALVLKTLAEAERDGDHIYAVIKGTGISNAGVRNGFTVPNPNQQAAAIEQALEDAGIDPRTMGYVEGHGSGTSLGDPIEVKALTQAYRKYTSDLQFCPIGTVKSNVAHLLAAAGVAGIAKVLMQMKHGQLTPSLHAETLNPNIPFAETPFYVQRELANWPRLRDDSQRDLPRRAGVTSIGAGGMNSHIILEEYAPLPTGPRPVGPDLFVFSAMTQATLLASLERFCAHLTEQPTLALSDVAYTLQVGKNELPCRLALVASTREELTRALTAFAATPSAWPGLCYTRNILEKDPRVDRARLAGETRLRRLEQIAAFWADGVAIDWDVLNEGREVRRVSLPSYPFERVRCWYPEHPDAPSVVHPLGAQLKLHPFIGANRSDLRGLRYVTPIHLTELLDYVYAREKTQRVLPTVVADIVAAAARIAGVEGPQIVRDLNVQRAVAWSEVAELACRVEPRSGGVHVVLETRNAAGALQPFAQAFASSETPPGSARVTLERLRAEATRTLDHQGFYAALGRHGLSFKPYLEVVERAWLQPDGAILCEIRSSHPQQDFFKRNLQLPPRLLGAAYQALVLGTPNGAELTLARIAAVWIGDGEATQMLLRAGRAERDVLFLDDAGAVVAALNEVSLLPADELKDAAHVDAAVKPPIAVVRGPEPQSDWLHRELRVLAAQVLKFSPDDVNVRAPFYDLGFDSISLTRLANEINVRYGSALTPAIFFECEHIDALSAHLLARYDVQPPTRAAIALPAADRIAIVGMAARLPGSDDPLTFFDHLLAGHDLITGFPFERYSDSYRERLAAAGFAKQGGFLTDIDRFDAAFFHISPVEAERMDPQQRLMLETVWRALEDAGYRSDELPGDTGVFVGVTGHDYASLLQAHGVEHDGFASTGNSLAMVANRISHHLDVHGPSQSVDTACSSSLVALLRAADAIRSGRCHAAIVGGVNLALSLEGFEGPYQAGMLSPDGRSKTFSKSADGYVRGEGVVALLLRPLADAERDGDRILGLFIGGAENHGGRAGSLTAPNAKAQAALVERAMAGIDPASIGYIETHGTGTSLGDPVEINGLRLAYRALLGERAPASPFIGLGSVKSNIGHLEAAAGLAGVVKVLMAMRRGELPATLHCDEVNPYIDLRDSPFYLVRARQPWPRRSDSPGRELPRRAGVSSFGFGGANAHAVFEEYPSVQAASRRTPLAPRPFADTRYWIPGAQRSGAGPGRAKVLLTSQWVETPREAGSLAVIATHLVLPCEIVAPVFAGPVQRVLALPSLAGDIAARYQSLALYLLETLQRQLREPGAGRVLIQLAVPLGDERELYEGLGAMLDTACAESPRVIGQVVGVPPTITAGDLARILADEAGHPADRRVRYQNGGRWTRVWSDLPLPPRDRPAHQWRPGGVYLITGGMGALGRLVACDIARRAPGTTLILSGSSPLDASRRAFLDELQAMGARASYHRANVADADAVGALVRGTVAAHGRLHGVIHCAGIHRDNYILQKSAEELHAVLAPKVGGAVALERACRGVALDCFVLFSSLGGAVGNPGQADYAAANGFLDAFAAHHQQPMIALDWPLWRDGGMRVDVETERALAERMGQLPLSTEEGLDALHTAIASGARQVAVIAGEEARIRAFFAGAPRQIVERHVAPMAAADTAALLDRTIERLRLILARVAGIRVDLLEANEQLDRYGIDSLLITRLNRELGEIFGALPKTLFFEHRTLAALARRLVDDHASACRRWTGVANTEMTGIRVAASSAPVVCANAELRESMAVIGISGRYPGAPDLDTFWANLAAGRDAIGEVPAERWELAGFYHAEPIEAVEREMSYSKWGGFLEGFADFDPLFFKISPRDAAAMDPQERLFLMIAWGACEDAGYTRARLAARHGSRVGVFAGITKTGFALHGPYRPLGGGTVRPSTSFGSLANRVSHFLDLNGPSMPIDTMCSSSLTAIHEACEHLRSGDCELALAGGVNLYLHPSTYVELSASRMLSPDGRCRSFGKGANGFVPGEGVGCVLLKPLSRAITDGDRIHAVIRGTAINHGGKTNGYTVPNPVAQRDVIREALDRAGLDARAVSYVEAHGTGTELGDPIEVTGLTQAFRVHTNDRGFCALGSAKSNIGHLEAAAGIAGLTKVILQMKHRALAPSLHLAEVNPHIDFSDTPFVLQRDLADWIPTRKGEARIAGVSSFGAGGANAHIVVEEWAPPASSPGAAAMAGPVPILLSAREPATVRKYAARLLAVIEADTGGPARPASGLPPEPVDAEAAVRTELAGLLSVTPDEIDSAERFDAYGVDAPCHIGLRKSLEARFDVVLDAGVFLRLLSVNEVVAELRAQIRSGAAVLREESLSLLDIAYTLQVGREAMDVRLAIEATTLDELAAGLRAYLDGQEHAPGLHTGRVSDHRAVLAPLLDDADFAEVVRRWMERGQLGKILGLWVKGLDVDWTRLPRAVAGSVQPRIVTLPTYPFECERYWVSTPSADWMAGTVGEAIASAGDAPGGEILLARCRELERQLARLIPVQLRAAPASGIKPGHARWREAIDTLLARVSDDSPACGDADAAWSEWDSYKRDATANAGPLAQIALAETTLRALPKILTGEQSAIAVMFPAGAMHLVEDVYKQDAVAARFNASIAAAARAFVNRRLMMDPGARLRILEIGAGTGGTSEAVFQALAPCRDAIAEYRFTDVSRSFLIRAERQFRATAPYLRTALFDVERPPAGQDVAGGAYDLVIAANVLHTARDMRQTMANVLATLRAGGLLLINETSSSTLFTHVTFGLLDGWWRFEDAALRIPGSPSLTPGTWRTVLEEAGFKWVAGTSDRENALGQQIIAATPRSAIPAPAFEARSPANAGMSLRDLILGLLSETLNVEPATINVNALFADYGLDSILGVEFIHKLRRALGVELEVTRLFDFSTVAQLEAFLAKHNAAAVAAPVDGRLREPVQAHSGNREPIAIVGMSGRFARSANVDQLWEHLLAGRDLVEPASRFDLNPYYKDAAPGSYCRHGSFIEGVEQFDPVFFGISGLEATYMDPQQRLFLEEAWKTLESAGHAGADMEGRRCGVFVGCSSGDYQELFHSQPPGQAFWGNTCSLIPARIAYYLDFKGPAVAVDTACSSSLVAVHLACQSLWSGDTEMALAGGVFVQSSPRFYRYANQARMLSPSGRCAAFGEGADGIVPGEAVAALLLRPLRDAIADGDSILGVIIAAGTNQDGTTNGITAPSAVSQERLIRQVYDESGIDPASIGMVEAHGTGTVLGDPIEHAALTRAFRAYTDRNDFCALGSIKSNLGHATTAAGVTGLVKILLSLEHGQVPPTIHVGRGNPEIHTEGSPFFLNSEPRAWPPSKGNPRRAAISSFGFSGTNAHMVIEEAPERPPAAAAAPGYLVALSARTAGQLRQQAERLLAHIVSEPKLECADIAFTLLSGRKHFHHRLAVVASGTDDLAARLRDWLNGGAASGIQTSEVDEQGRREDAAAAQEPGMDDYRARLDEAAQLFLSGTRLRFDKLFDRATQRRIPLPTYPLATNRYWVDAPKTPAAPAAVRTTSLASPANPPRFTLAPLSSLSPPVRNERAELRRLPDLDGVRQLEFEGPWSEALRARLAGELASAAADEKVRAVLLSGEGDWRPAAGSPPPTDTVRAPFACPLPVVAALRSSASGAGLLLAMHCDFVVLAEEGRYSCGDELPRSQALLFERRLGEGTARELLVEGREILGSQLRARGVGTLIVASGRVEAEARTLASRVAEAPRLALVELKRHMRSAAPAHIAAAPMAVSDIDPFDPPFAGAGRRIDLDSEVIEMEAFEDGVVLLRMCERLHKNTFTEAFMRGLIEAFDQIRRSPRFKVVVLTGHDAYFACGGTSEGLESLQRGATRFTDLKIYSLPLECELPVVAAMQGHAIGAGWSLPGRRRDAHLP